MASDSENSDDNDRRTGSVLLRELIRKRGVEKGKLTLFKKYLLKLNPLSLTAENFLDLELRVEKISTVLEQFEEVQDKIETLTFEVEKELEERESFENSYYECVAKAKGYLKKQVSTSSNPPLTNPPQFREPTDSIKYPEISLPSFSGNITNWIEFRDTFDALVNQSNLKSIQKFKYLRSCLKDSAREVVSSLEYSEEGYAIAWQLLCERYNNPRVLVFNHLRALFNIDAVPTNATALRGLADNISKHLRTLRSLNVSIEGWDLLVIFFLSSKLDPALQRKWEEKINTRDLPTLQDFKAFLRTHADLHEALNHAGSSGGSDQRPSRKALVATSSPDPNSKVNHKKYHNQRTQCSYCREGHYITQCPKFLALDVQSRIRAARKASLCTNCLGSNHTLPNCRATHCRTCKAKHHTLLHLLSINNTPANPDPEPGPRPPSTLYTPPPTNTPPTQPSTVNMHTNHNSPNQHHTNVILSTAKITVQDAHNQSHTMRALLDSGSQSNYITQHAFNMLQLPARRINMEVIGFNEKVTKINQLGDLTIHSKDNTFSTKIACFIVPNICKIPSIRANIEQLNIPQRFNLADETFYDGGEVDMVLGAEIFYQLLCIGQHRLGENLPILQRTRLGWIVSGSIPVVDPITQVQCNCIVIRKGLLDEESHQKPTLKNDDISRCEQVFSSHTRTPEGNFVVSIPLKEPMTSLGRSYPIAYKRFKSLEAKFEREPEFKRQYVKFMREFIDAGHMVEIPETEPCIYLPHHAVLNPQKTTTPLRVVIDASCKTSSGKSLNDIQHKGTINQDDLANILLRFRTNKYIVNADIQKMYTRIYVNQNQQFNQCILWRENTAEPLRTYNLTTLSFGLKCAPYLATRCLLQLAYENRGNYPDAAETIRTDFYMDDMLHGGDDETQLALNALRVDNILRSANFYLRKWKSNSPAILKALSNNTQIQPTDILTELGPNTHKVLGLAWSSDRDIIQYVIKTEPVPTNLTKRKVLSTASAIFDPLGLLGPLIVIAKCFIQRLWKLKASWDENLPNQLREEWVAFYDKLPVLNALTIPRHCLANDCVTAELHGFCDSSLAAYGAVIYIRSIDKNGSVVIRLLCAKSRVARMETIPKLELRAALLLATLFRTVSKALNKTFKPYFWSDSNVALAWINSQSSKLNTFVKNRVTEIKGLTEVNDWRWVPSRDNPADVLSRGLHADKLATCALWWQGPSWLSGPASQWPSQPTPNADTQPNNESNYTLTDTHCNVCINPPTVNPNNEFMSFIFERWSSLTKLNRRFAFMLRFIFNCKNPDNKKSGPLSVQELNEALNKLIYFAQINSYPTEYKLLLNHKPLPQSSHLLSLNPFIEQGLRVGGRLTLSNYDYNKKHPIILPRNHTLSKLIAIDQHIKLLHAGPQLLLASMRERFWPIHGKQLANRVVHECMACFRAKPQSSIPMMGNLPVTRVTPAPPFHITSVDYAGFFMIRDRRGRGFKASKCYIAIFVCAATKAIHIELVSSLETTAFLAAFRRFTSRRGKPKEMLSDNGTTFHGANNEINDLYTFLNSNSKEFETSCANEGIIWKFLPAYSPHMGGLHEAAVKSCKHHLKRILGQALLTYEEFSTILIQVEAVLNSRPLCPIPSSNDDEIFYLTPAHFLIGRTPVSVPDYDYTDMPMSKLTHYHQLQQLHQNFWKTWSRDYIGLLQERTRWRSSKGQELRRGTMVLIKDDRLPPCLWRLGRIIGCCPGQDGITRVAEIRTARGPIKRAFNNICPLPLDRVDT